MEELGTVAIGAGFSLAEVSGDEDLSDETESEIEQDDSLKMKIIFPEAPPSEDPFFLDKLLARIKFRESMTAEGLRDAEPEAVQNVSEALELIQTGGMSNRAEELFREGLGLTE